MSIAAGRSWLASVRGALSFVAGPGIRLFAAKGKVEMQAQGEAMWDTAAQGGHDKQQQAATVIQLLLLFTRFRVTDRDV